MKKPEKKPFAKTIAFSALFLHVLLFVVGNDLEAQNFVTTYAGTGSAGFVNGDTSIASFNRPFGICIDPDGNLYIADAYNHCIRKIGTDGMVSTYAGTGTAGYLDGPAADAKFNQQAIQLDVSAWNKGVYFVEYQDVSNTHSNKTFIVL